MCPTRPVEGVRRGSRFESLDDPRGHAAHHRVGRHVARHHGPGGHHRVLADGHPLQDGGVRANPHVAPHGDGGGVGGLAPCGLEEVVERGEHHAVPHLAAVAQRHAAVVLEVAAGVDEHPAPDVEVLAEIRVERREDAHRVVHPVAHQARQQAAHLVGRMVGGVQFERDAPGIVGVPNLNQIVFCIFLIINLYIRYSL